MDDQIIKLNSILKKQLYSLTKPRLKVFQLLQREHPLTIGQIVSRLNKQVDRASVYRTVKLFEDLTIIVRISRGFKYQLELSGDFTYHHHHMRCLKCQKLFDLVEDQKLEYNIKQLADSKGFLMRSHQLEIQGYCINCQE